MDAHRLQSLFSRALDLPENIRNEFVRSECGDDLELTNQLQALLRVDSELGGMTARKPAAGLTGLIDGVFIERGILGRIVGPYRIGDMLGQGGMGTVYRAERVDGVIEQQVAIKFVRPEMIDANTLRRFQLERQTLANLDHPNIARLIDASALDDALPYFVMEYIEGKSITAYCAEKELDLTGRLSLLRLVCAAVSHAHQQLIVHRDIKPGNVLVNAQGVPKLLDFGIAKSVGPSSTLELDQTGTAQQFLSLNYVAPEQLLGHTIGVSCDVYALGLLLYELTSGQRPFDLDALSPGQIERLVLMVPPPAPSQRTLGKSSGAIPASSLRGDLDAIALRCLRKEPKDRYGSVEQLDEELSRFLDGRPIATRKGQGLYRAGKFIARHRLALALASLVAFVMVASLAVLIQKNHALARAQRSTEQSLAILKDAFTAADPLRTSGDEVTARKILDAARQRIEQIREMEPDVYAQLGTTIAEVDNSVGRYAEALNVATRAAESASTTSSDIALLQRLHSQRALALINLIRFEEAEVALEQARVLGVPDTQEIRVAGARLLASRQSYATAASQVRNVVDETAQQGPESRIANHARLTLAEILRLAGDEPGSLQVLDETLTWLRASLEESHPLITQTRLRRVVPLRAAGRIEDSLLEATALADEIVRLYGPDSPETASARTALARTLSATGREPEALRVYNLALGTWQRALGRDHPNAMRAMFNYAYSLQLSVERQDEAESIYRDLLTLASERLGPEAEIVVYYRLFYAHHLHAIERDEDALRLLASDQAERGLEISSAANRADYLKLLESVHRTVCGSQTPPQPKFSIEQCSRSEQILSSLSLSEP